VCQGQNDFVVERTRTPSKRETAVQLSFGLTVVALGLAAEFVAIGAYGSTSDATFGWFVAASILAVMQGGVWTGQSVIDKRSGYESANTVGIFSKMFVIFAGAGLIMTTVAATQNDGGVAYWVVVFLLLCASWFSICWYRSRLAGIKGQRHQELPTEH
jgi:hypothetical protein